jgi:hypothetical protein
MVVLLGLLKFVELGAWVLNADPKFAARLGPRQPQSERDRATYTNLSRAG